MFCRKTQTILISRAPIPHLNSVVDGFIYCTHDSANPDDTDAGNLNPVQSKPK